VAQRVVEAVVTAAVGAALGRVVGGLISPTLGWIAAGIAGANGLLSGWRQIYSWRNRDGLPAFVLDSTWGIVMVAGSLLAHGWAAVTHAAHNEVSLSTRQNRHVYRRGAQLQPGYTLTLGNVISGAGDVDEQTPTQADHRSRRRSRVAGALVRSVSTTSSMRCGASVARWPALWCGYVAVDQSRSVRSCNRSRTTRTRSSGGPTAVMLTGRRQGQSGPVGRTQWCDRWQRSAPNVCATDVERSP